VLFLLHGKNILLNNKYIAIVSCF